METDAGREKDSTVTTRLKRRDGQSLSSDSGLVVARGTKEGLVIRLDAGSGYVQLEDELRDFLVARHTFVSGQEVTLEWVNDRASSEERSRVEEVVLRDFDVRVRSSRVLRGGGEGAEQAEQGLGIGSAVRKIAAGLVGGRATIEAEEISEKAATPTSLFSGFGTFERDSERGSADTVALGGAVWDEPNAKVVCSTLRSGQRIESEHTVVILGDVNSGAEVVSGGHVVVLGSLRGLAHAGAFEDSDGPAYIIALSLQPTQLRIGGVISRSNGRLSTNESGPEIARVDGDSIVVEKYHPRVVAQRAGRFF